jgi:hypothetical protein
MQLTFLQGYPDYVGKRFNFAGYGNGPASYVATGDPIALPRFNNYIDVVFPALSVSGAYRVEALPSGYGPRQTWSLLWSGVLGTVASVAQNAAGTGMTAGTYIVNATGGGGAGAQISVTVLTATTIATPVVLNAGVGYTSAPTFTLTGTGGTPATLTATLTTAGPVAPTTNLSGETVQIGGFGGVY